MECTSGHNGFTDFRPGHGTPPLETPEGLTPVSRTHSVRSIPQQAAQEETPSKAPEPSEQQSTPSSPTGGLIPAKLAHGSLMLAALALGPAGADAGGGWLKSTDKLSVVEPTGHHFCSEL